jgi:hypothetical protein
VLRRALTLLDPPVPFGGGGKEGSGPVEDGASTMDLSPTDYTRLAGPALQAIRTIACLLRDKRALSGGVLPQSENGRTMALAGATVKRVPGPLIAERRWRRATTLADVKVKSREKT